MRAAAHRLSAALLPLLAACSQMPHYERPPAPVASAFAHSGAAHGIAAPDFEWQQFFADPGLRKLIATALQANRDLRVATLSIAQTRAQYDIRSAERYPAVGASISGTRAPDAGGGINSTYTAGIVFSAWEIDLFGRIASLGEAARAQFLATEEARNGVQLSLVANVASLWLNLQADEEQLALIRQTLVSREESLRLIRLRFDAGASSELEWRQAETLTETARVALAQQQRQYALDLNALTLLVGAPVAAAASVASVAPSEARIAALQLPDLPAGAPSEVLLRRPDVRQAEQQLIAAQASIGAARAAFFPRIALSAGVGTASSELRGLFKDGSWGFSIAPSLLLPIFDAGRNRAALASAEAGRDIALAQYEQAIQSAFREVSDALAGRAFLGDQLLAQSRVAAAEATRLRLSQLRYDGGVANSLELLDAQRSQFAAQQALIAVQLARLQNQVALYRALGGGWFDKVAP